MTEATLRAGLPDPEIFRQFRADVGWGTITPELALTALVGSQFGVVAEAEGRTVGFGRVTGDGALTYYIEDLIVAEAWRGRGLGKRILTALVARIEEIAAPGAMVALLSAKGVEPFYEANGFFRRPASGYGAAMMRIVPAPRWPSA